MKNIYILLLFSAVFLFSCEKSDPEIAPNDELSAISYQEKIYAQPVVVDNQIISVQRKETATYLTAFAPDGSIAWSNDIDEYIIDGSNYEIVPYVELEKNADNQIFLNFYDIDQQNSEIIKSVRFDRNGNYLSEFQDSVHQKLPPNVTIDRRFTGLSVLPIDNGNVWVVSSLTLYNDRKTFLQVSEYDENGAFLKDTTYSFNQVITLYKVYLASNNRLVMIVEEANTGAAKIVVFDPETSELFFSDVFPIFDVFAFYENSRGEFIFTVSSFVDDLQYYGLIIAITDQAEYLWHRVYTEKNAWLFTSITEVKDGYVFAGFDITGQLLKELDWRTTFGEEKTLTVVMKTNAEGLSDENTGWVNRLTLPAINAGAAVLPDDQGNYMVLLGKYDRQIVSSLILKINNKGMIVNQ